MDFIKKQSVAFWVYCIGLILNIATVIVYNVNISGQGYFNGANVPAATRFTVVALVLFVLIMALAQLRLEGTADKIVCIVADVARICVPAALAAALINLVSARITGFAFIYFSNPEVLQEVQTAANISSAHGTIANMVMLGITAVVAIAGAAFRLKRNA